MSEITALLDFNRFKNAMPAGTPEKRKADLVALHSVGEMAWWIQAERLVESDIAMDWCADGYKTQWEWWQAFVEGNGFPRPADSEYAAFQMQVRCGRFSVRCRNLAINPELLISVGRSKVDIIARHTQDADRDAIATALSRAVELSRPDVHRLFSVDSRNGRTLADANAGDLSHDNAKPPTDTDRAQMFDAETEPPAAAPIPMDDRPANEYRYHCTCGRVHVVLGNVDEYRVEGP